MLRQLIKQLVAAILLRKRWLPHHAPLRRQRVLDDVSDGYRFGAILDLSHF